MKAIVCPQCGGLIKKVSEEKQLAECSYCGARIFIERAAEAEKKPPIRNTQRAPLEDYKPIDDYEPTAEVYENPWEHPGANESLNTVLGVAGAGAILIFIFVIFGVSTRNNTVPEPSVPVYTRSTPLLTAYQPPSAPVYSNEDAIKLPKPVIPRKMRIREETEIQVYISIDEGGNVYDANAFDGPEELQKVAVEAAKKAKFPKSDNNEKAMGTLVYEFSPK